MTYFARSISFWLPTEASGIGAEIYFWPEMAEEENFIVSARKYRPANWQEVIGQESITDTLKNAIEQEHLAHAYLFCGPRGVGKTTCARIFAKEINRSEEHLDEDFSFNIFELDAASNNKVDDIRSLTDQVRIPPQVGEYKVYIIDEVHMLSTQAFNAFLKTLEEPPKHAIFILATTEKHKIIPTILSRCQIYDFNRIGVDEIVSHLKGIAEKEEITFEEEALHVIAQKADGALRDALSIFDQLSNFTNRQLIYDAVLKNLHVLDYDYYFRLTDFLYANDYASALLMLDEILRQGFDGGHFITGLGSHFRDLLVCQDPRTVALLEVAESAKTQYGEQAEKTDSAWLLEALKIVSQTEIKLRNSMNQRLLLEVGLLELAGLSAEKKNDQRELTSEASRIKEPAKPIAQEKPAVETEPPPPPPAPKAEPAPEPESKAPTAEPEMQAEVEPVEAPAAVVEEPEVAPTEPEPTPALKNTSRRSRRTTTTSINLDRIDEPAAAEAETSTQPEPATIVEEAEAPAYGGQSLEKAWEQVCQKALDEGKNALYTILVRQNPTAGDTEKQITVALHHGVEEEEFNQHKSDVLQGLRELCGDSAIQLQTAFMESKEETKLFGPKEKFEYLAKKNPKLIKLKQDLDLDIHF